MHRCWSKIMLLYNTPKHSTMVAVDTHSDSHYYGASGADFSHEGDANHDPSSRVRGAFVNHQSGKCETDEAVSVSVGGLSRRTQCSGQ